MLITKWKNLKRYRIELCDSIDDPISNWIKCQKFHLMSDKIGEGINDLPKRLEATYVHAKAGDNDKVMLEIENTMKLINSLLDEKNFNLISFAAMVKSINKETVDVSTDDKIEEMAERLLKIGISVSDLIKGDEVKKKIQTERQVYCEKSETNIPLFLAYKNLVSCQLDNIIEGENDFKMNAAYKTLSKLTIVNRFPDEIIRIDKEFEKVCSIMQLETPIPVKKMSIKEWDTAYDIFQQRYSKAS